MSRPKRMMKIDFIDLQPGDRFGELHAGLMREVWHQRTTGPLMLIDEPRDFTFWGFAVLGRYCVIDAALPETLTLALNGKPLSALIDVGINAVIRNIAQVTSSFATTARQGHFMIEKWSKATAIIVEIEREDDVIDDQADDTPLDQDDQSWRELTDEQIEEIRHA